MDNWDARRHVDGSQDGAKRTRLLAWRPPETEPLVCRPCAKQTKAVPKCQICPCADAPDRTSNQQGAPACSRCAAECPAYPFGASPCETRHTRPRELLRACCPLRTLLPSFLA